LGIPAAAPVPSGPAIPTDLPQAFPGPFNGAPAPPADPNAPIGTVPPLTSFAGTLAQNGKPTGLGGLPDAAGATDPSVVLGQNAVPSKPGAAAAGTPLNLNPLTNGYLLPQSDKPAAPGQASGVGADPATQNDAIGGREYWHRLWDQYHSGGLKGGSLSQRPQQDLGQPLPGTAPAPGAAVPPGLVQFQPDPAAPPPAP
jgi:hypothetical protein